MSTLRADQITNSAGTGAPLFPNGANLISGGSGTVGIGTTSPSASRLHVAAGSSGIAAISPAPTLFVESSNLFGSETAIQIASGGSSATIYLGVGGNNAATRILAASGVGTLIQDNTGTGSIVFNTGPGERLRIDSAGAITQVNAVSGRGAIVGEQTFRRTADGTAIGPAIADFFGATSAISLEALSVYEIIAYLVFTKTTAGTITLTMAASSAQNRMAGIYIGSPLTGIGAGSPQWGSAGSQGATTAPFVTTGSLTTGVNHVFQLNMQVQTILTSSWRLQITSSAGTVTPLAGSYYTVKKISATTGTFVA